MEVDLFMKNFLSKPIIVTILLVLFTILLFTFLMIPKAVEETKVVLSSSEKSYQISDSSLLPPDYKYPTPTPVRLPKVVSTVSPKPKVSTKKVSAPKPTSSPKPIPEEIASTLESRDEDRVVITQLLADKVSEYFFYYGILPDLYLNKSEVLLETKSSDIVYFYNVKQNKTNALSLNLDIDSYKFKKISSCENNWSLNGDISFVYDKSDSIKLCLEKGIIQELYLID